MAFRLGMRIFERQKTGFTLIELLAVVSIVSVLMAILLPVLGKARMRARIVSTNIDLCNIGLALEAYAYDNDGVYPLTRVDCAMPENYYQLPSTLAGKYLPEPETDGPVSVGIKDRFSKSGFTYKYQSVGGLLQNGSSIDPDGAKLYIPDGFPYNRGSKGKYYNDLKNSPVSWIVYSVGVGFDLETMVRLRYPVNQESWLASGKKTGIITRVKLLDGTQMGSYE